MPKLLQRLLITAALLTAAGAAHASFDWSCDSRGLLLHRTHSSCGDRAMLQPGNDPRSNLWMMLVDRNRARFAPPLPPEPDDHDFKPAAYFSWSDISTTDIAKIFNNRGKGRCVSNVDGAKRFTAALAAENALSAEERRSLQAARSLVAAHCGKPEETAAALSVLTASPASAAAQAFAAYVATAAVFYGTDPAAARHGFETLSSVHQPWVAEASRYMVARTDLNTAQVNAWSDYGNFVQENVDRPTLDRARRELGAYLGQYPRGVYALSAAGLLRRAAWLSADAREAARLYSLALTATPANRMSELLDEVATHALQEDVEPTARLPVDHPFLMAVNDLQRMQGEPGKKAELSTSQLEAQTNAFASEPALFRYLQASHALYVQNQPARALALLPETTPRSGALSYLDFSSRMLRLSIQEQQKPGSARDGFTSLMPLAIRPYQRSLVELGLAISDEYSGHVERVFARDSQVHDPYLRITLLRYVASPELLAQQTASTDLTERDNALFVLLYRDLSRARYADFNQWLTRLPADLSVKPGDWRDPRPNPGVFRWAGTAQGKDYACPTLSTITATLATTPHDAHARLCLGEFLRLNGFDRHPLAAPSVEEAKKITDQRTKHQLGASGLQWPVETVNRQSIYRAVMDDKAASNDDRAYALLRAIRCYAPAGINDCGGEEAPKSERRYWFDMLKSRYASSRWASAVQSYW